ncbi:DNA mismatch repair endonuclease MutL, partial [Pseudoalteromonas luteoviolacea]
PKPKDRAGKACAEGRDMAVQVQPTAHPNGTTIEVKDLFFNTPARRKFLRTEKTEFSHIDELVKRIALSRFDIAITLTHNQKVVRQYRAKQDPRCIERVAQVAGRVFQREASFIESGYEGLELYGWVLPLGSNTQPQYTYVNGRMMRDKLILHAIRQAFEEATGSPETPGFVIYLELDPRQVDVNVHPAKHEVRFHQARLVHDFIVQAVKQVVEPNRSVLSYTEEVIQTEPNMVVCEPSAEQNQLDQHQSYRTPLRHESAAVAPSSMSSTSVTSFHDSNTSDFGGHSSRSHKAASRNRLDSATGQTKQVNVNQLYQAFTTESNNRPIESSSAEQSTPHIDIDKEQRVEQTSWMPLPDGAVLLQHTETLMVGHTRDGLSVMWQEQIETDGTLLGKALLLPVRVNQSQEESAVIERVNSWLTLLGFDLTFQDAHVMVKKLPVSLYSLDVGQCMARLLETCNDSQNNMDNLRFWVDWLLKNTPKGYFNSQHFLKVREKMLKKQKSRAAIMAKAVKIEPSYILDLLPKGY